MPVHKFFKNFTGIITWRIVKPLKGQFTRRTILGKVAGVFDPLGLVTPVSAKFKLDLNSLNRLKLDWDDPIPPEHLPVWVKNLEKIQEIRGVKFRRTIIPENAMNTNVELI